MSNRLIRKIVKEKRDEIERARSGTAGWSPDDIPDPVDPDGPPDEGTFIGYACMLGQTPAWAKAEYERQKQAGGNKWRERYGL